MEFIEQLITTKERGGEPNKAVCLLCDVVEQTGGHMESVEQLITHCSLSL